MTRHVPLRAALLASLSLVVAAFQPPPSASPAAAAPVAAPATDPPVRVTSFNLRYDTPNDGANAWPHRRDWVAGLIRFHALDAVGVQEALATQLGDLDARLPGFARVGVGRAD